MNQSVFLQFTFTTDIFNTSWLKEHCLFPYVPVRSDTMRRHREPYSDLPWSWTTYPVPPCDSACLLYAYFLQTNLIKVSKMQGASFLEEINGTHTKCKSSISCTVSKLSTLYQQLKSFSFRGKEKMTTHTKRWKNGGESGANFKALSMNWFEKAR